MIIGQVVLSLGLIGSGFLVEAFPTTIAGYNMMSKEEKQKIDIVKLSKFLKKILILLGLSTFGIYLILKALNLKLHFIFLINCTLIVLTLVIASMYTRNNFKK